MNISLNWLKRYVELPESPIEIGKVLTSLGLEIEGMHNFGETYKELRVAKVLKCEPHPDSDHLSITCVFDGTQELQVVCGAPNVAAGQTVAFAPVGSVLPLSDGTSLKLKKVKIRGVESLGMICAEDEIGLGDSHAGIMVLDNAHEAGTPLVDLGLYDVVYEVNVTPNRPDALCHIGVARELAARFGRNLKMPVIPTVPKSNKTSAQYKELQVDSASGCSRYVGRVIENVKTESSPDWLKRLLVAVGVTPVNNIVDITNFVLLETGQPLHSFDLNKLSTAPLKVRLAKAGEKLETIDHNTHDLIPSDLLICDGDKPACVAGVMGGVESEIQDSTTHVFLETAWFEPPVIRRQARRLGLSSDSSYRFERGIDPFMQDWVNHYSAALIAQVTGGVLCETPVEYTASNHKSEQLVVSLRNERIQKVLGIAINESRVIELLQGIGLQLLSSQAGVHQFLIPGFRPDLEREIDLVEEVARLIGYDNIPVAVPAFPLQINTLPAIETVGRVVRRTLAAQGLHECVSLRFSSKSSVQKIFGESANDPRSNPIELLNPLNDEWAVLPVSLIPSMLESVVRNVKNRSQSVRLFEVGKAFFKNEDLRSDKNPGVTEKNIVSGVVAGDWSETSYTDAKRNASTADLAGVLRTLFKQLGLEIGFTKPQVPESFLHPNKQMSLLLNNKVVGIAGELHPAVASQFGIQIPLSVFEFDFSPVIKKACKPATFKPFAKTGVMVREISMEVDARLEHGEILKKVKNIPTKNLIDVQLKSLYQGDKVQAGRKAVLYRFDYQNPESTLTDSEVNKAQERLAEKLLQDPEIDYR
jgi:phenylalanyl-tRNA synthetase beta chain